MGRLSCVSDSRFSCDRDLIQLQPMIPTYVFGWPTGKEVGNYLAVDLGELALPLDTLGSDTQSSHPMIRAPCSFRRLCPNMYSDLSQARPTEGPE